MLEPKNNPLLAQNDAFSDSKKEVDPAKLAIPFFTAGKVPTS
jgi:hypothetical protein